MDFMMNEAFIQVMDKPNKELQLHVESRAMPQIVHNYKKFRMRQMVRTK